jgi:ABC-type antimicrobial peptide transport system permease subunit
MIIAIMALFVFVLIGFVLLLVYDTPTTSGLICDRDIDRCIISQTSLLGTKVKSIKLMDIIRADVRPYPQRKNGNRQKYVLYLVANSDSHYVTDFPNSVEAQTYAMLIDAYLGDTVQQQIAFQKKGPIMYGMVWVLLIAGLIGLIALLSMLVLQRRIPAQQTISS